MKKYLLPLLLLFLSGCGLFTQNNEPKDRIVVEETSIAVETVEETIEPEVTSEEPAQAVDNVFGEDIIGDNPYPPTALTSDIPVVVLRDAMDEYFAEIVPAEEKNNSTEPIDEDILDNIQLSLDTNAVYEPLEATVDQMVISLQDQDQYVLRIVIPMPPEEARKIEPNNDILLLNEALAQVGNRLVLIAYLDQSGEFLIPYHLNTSTYSLFSQGE